MTTTVSPGFTNLAVCAGAPATSNTDRAKFSGKSSGNTAYIPDSNNMAFPLISTWSTSCLISKNSSILRGVRDRDTSVANLSPTFKSVFPSKAEPIFYCTY